MKPTIRIATIKDLSALRALEKKLIDFERPLDSGIVQTGEIHYYDLPAILQDPKEAVVFIVETDGQAVGCGMGLIKRNPGWAKRQLFGMTKMIYVEEAHRGQGIASQILKAIQTWFLAQGVEDIRIQVYTSNTGAIKAYKKNGFKPFVSEMQLAL